MSKISFEDIGCVVATCYAQQGVHGGQVVKLTGNGEVGPCAEGDKFCGVALEPRTDIVGVQVSGFVTVGYTGSLTPGWASLAADGKGGVKSASTGVIALVVSADSDGTAVVCL